ncbi:hypothetical protein [Actinomadura gamaensis]|uniref:Uncharacterized protein n=1 Tax=Actinomadura gamaensis TaxID=1763541 RepID=A0ABV9U2D9_9ACTN
MNLEEDLVYRLLLAVDIQGYSRLTARQQLAAQHDLAAVLDRAAAAAGLRRADWIEQVGGDGELATLPAGTAPAAVAGDFVLGFDAALRDVNAARDAGGRAGAPRGWRLRVRLALHHGTLTPGPFGPAGDAPVAVQRLLDSAALRRLLDDPRRDLAVVVSDAMFADVVRSGFCALPAAAFEPVRITAKGAVFRGHLLTRPPEAGRIRPVRERPVRAAEGDPPVRLSDLTFLTGVGARGDDLN